MPEGDTAAVGVGPIFRQAEFAGDGDGDSQRLGDGGRALARACDEVQVLAGRQ